MPAGLLVTVPVPLPDKATERVGFEPIGWNVAVTTRSEFIVNTQGPVPEQAPPQPRNTSSVVCNSVTIVPVRN